MAEFLYGGKEPNILAVDDDEICLVMLDRIFSDEGHIVCVHSGEEALDYLSKNLVDLVLLDFRMPKMDGLEVLRRMKKNTMTAPIPVIILTGDIEAKLESEGFMAGATDFIRKPFIPYVVKERVRRVLRYEYLQEYLRNEVARQTALANERLASSLRLYRETVLALAKTIDAKDPYTHGHSERVAEYARKISLIAGDSEDDAEEIYTMGLLHDIGKIGVPSAIINKPSRLTDEEYEIIKSHTTIGSDILRIIKERPELSTGARSHHERFDGLGYPDGLSGTEIDRTARIIAVADAYDAMTSRRSYRGIMPQTAVRAEIEKGTGRQFDPEFAAIMLRLIDEDYGFNMREL